MFVHMTGGTVAGDQGWWLVVTPSNEAKGTKGDKINTQGGCKEDHHPNQNENLKKAWTTSGHTSIFGTGSPFYDPER